MFNDEPPPESIEFLNEDECWQLLAGQSIGRLGVSINNKPDIFPVNFRLDEETIVVKTAAGLKLAAAAFGAEVVFEVDRFDDLAHTGWSVVVHGTGSEIESVEEVLDAERLLIEPWAGGARERYLRITPTRTTGRRVPEAKRRDG